MEELEPWPLAWEVWRELLMNNWKIETNSKSSTDSPEPVVYRITKKIDIVFRYLPIYQ